MFNLQDRAWHFGRDSIQFHHEPASSPASPAQGKSSPVPTRSTQLHRIGPVSTMNALRSLPDPGISPLGNSPLPSLGRQSSRASVSGTGFPGVTLAGTADTGAGSKPDLPSAYSMIALQIGDTERREVAFHSAHRLPLRSSARLRGHFTGGAGCRVHNQTIRSARCPMPLAGSTSGTRPRWRV